MPGSSLGYRLSPLAETDLEDIWLYTFRHWSLAQADSYHADLVAAFGQLASGDRTGRKADVREGYFKCPVGAHVVFYKASDGSIDVIRILHQRMDVDRHL